MKGDRPGMTVETQQVFDGRKELLSLLGPLAGWQPQLRVTLWKGPLSAAPRELLSGQWGLGCRLGGTKIAQLGDRSTEDLKVPGSTPGFARQTPFGASLVAQLVKNLPAMWET